MDTATIPNTLDEDVKREIKENIVKRLGRLFEAHELKAQDVAFMCGCSASYARKRMAESVPVSEIIRKGFMCNVAVKTMAVTEQSIKNYVASLLPDDRKRFLAELAK